MKFKLIQVCKGLKRTYERDTTYANGALIEFKADVDAWAYGDRLVADRFNGVISYRVETV